MWLKQKIKGFVKLLESVLYDLYYSIHPRETLMKQGHKLDVDVSPLLEIDANYGEWLIHPCVRYIHSGFNGYKWWMVFTPYPNFNSRYENPMLYYGDGNEDVPPKKWKFVGVVQGVHEKGYNADCNLFYYKEKLWITWKEAGTCNTCEEYGYKATMFCTFDGYIFSKPKVLCNNIDETNMYLASQTLMNINGCINILAVFTPNSYLPVSNSKKGPRNLAIFELCDKDNNVVKFDFKGIARQSYPRGFDFWHIDTFEYSGKYYCLATPEKADQILIGESLDGIHYKFCPIPLLHKYGKEKTDYTYKVSGVVVSDIFYLFYPMRSKNKSVVSLYVTSIKFSQLLSLIHK